MDAPNSTIWGPALWNILHHSVERIGLPLNKLPNEESRIWLNLLNSLRFSLPCPQCKKHYTAYLLSHPIVSFKKDTIRQWLYNIHSNVNTILNKSNDITLEQLEIYRQPFEFTKYYNIIITHMKQSLQIGWSILIDVQRTIRCFEELKRYYDF